MANPIHFTPKRVDPRKELERRLEAAPMQHAEALLVLFDVIEEAHDQGLLDLLHGAVGSKNAIAAKLAYYAKQPTSTQAIRNLLILGELLGSFDPTVLADTKKGSSFALALVPSSSQCRWPPRHGHVPGLRLRGREVSSNLRHLAFAPWIACVTFPVKNSEMRVPKPG
jgi:uncharacterized protein YjgD (DUF1641 family)